jgi:hypothetical protein
MPAPPNGRNGVMVSCYPWVQGMQEASAKREARHVPLSDTLVTMKFIDTLVSRNELLATGREVRPILAVSSAGRRLGQKIPINCDRHHGMIRLGSHYLHHGWGQTELEVFVPELW